MLSIARSMAVVLSENRVIYKFGEDAATFKAIGGGRLSIPWIDGGTLDFSNMFVILVDRHHLHGFRPELHCLGPLFVRDRRQ